MYPRSLAFELRSVNASVEELEYKAVTERTNFNLAGEACEAWGGRLLRVDSNLTRIRTVMDDLLGNESSGWAAWVGGIVQNGEVVGQDGSVSVAFGGRSKGCLHYLRKTQGLVSEACKRRRASICERVKNALPPIQPLNNYTVLWAAKISHAAAVQACLQAGQRLAAPAGEEDFRTASDLVGEANVALWVAGEFANNKWVDNANTELAYNLAPRANRCVQLAPRRSLDTGFVAELETLRCHRKRYVVA